MRILIVQESDVPKYNSEKLSEVEIAAYDSARNLFKGRVENLEIKDVLETVNSIDNINIKDVKKKQGILNRSNSYKSEKATYVYAIRDKCPLSDIVGQVNVTGNGSLDLPQNPRFVFTKQSQKMDEICRIDSKDLLEMDYTNVLEMSGLRYGSKIESWVNIQKNENKTGKINFNTEHYGDDRESYENILHALYDSIKSRNMELEEKCRNAVESLLKNL